MSAETKTGLKNRPDTDAKKRSGDRLLQWYETIFELIDLRSFSNLWYWIALAVMWSSASHYVIGVPFDLVVRAKRSGGQAQQDLEDLVRINVNRITYISGVSGLWLMGIVSAILTMLTLLGFYYQIELCQAVFLLFLPMTLLGALSLRTANRLQASMPEGEALRRALVRHRFWTQGLGIISIFVTAMWGMWQNMNLGALGA